MVFQHYTVLHFFPKNGLITNSLHPSQSCLLRPPDDRQPCCYPADELVRVQWTVHDGTRTSTCTSRVGFIGLVWAELDF